MTWNLSYFSNYKRITLIDLKFIFDCGLVLENLNVCSENYGQPDHGEDLTSTVVQLSVTTMGCTSH